MFRPGQSGWEFKKWLHALHSKLLECYPGVSTQIIPRTSLLSWFLNTSHFQGYGPFRHLYTTKYNHIWGMHPYCPTCGHSKYCKKKALQTVCSFVYLSWNATKPSQSLAIILHFVLLPPDQNCSIHFSLGQTLLLEARDVKLLEVPSHFDVIAKCALSL